MEKQRQKYKDKKKILKQKKKIEKQRWKNKDKK